MPMSGLAIVPVIGSVRAIRWFGASLQCGNQPRFDVAMHGQALGHLEAPDRRRRAPAHATVAGARVVAELGEQGLDAAYID
jgi:hypothetical protein